MAVRTVASDVEEIGAHRYRHADAGCAIHVCTWLCILWLLRPKCYLHTEANTRAQVVSYMCVRVCVHGSDDFDEGIAILEELKRRAPVLGYRV